MVNGSFGLVGSLLLRNELSSLDPLKLVSPSQSASWDLMVPVLITHYGGNSMLACSFSPFVLTNPKGGPRSFVRVPGVP